MSDWHLCYSSRAGQDRETEAFYRAQSRTVRRFCAQHGIDCEVA